MALTSDPRHAVISNPGNLVDKEWDVAEIVAHKHQGCQLLFKVCWKGYSLKDDTLEPAIHLYSASEVVQAYLTKHPSLSVSFYG